MAAYGYLPDPPDSRDWLLELSLEPPPSTPDSASAAHLLHPPFNQGNLGSCVAQAVSQLVCAGHALHQSQQIVPSRLALYYLARATHNDTQNDSGTFIRAAFKVLNKFGFAPEHLWPYSDSREPNTGGKALFQMMPPTQVFQSGFDQSAVTAKTSYRRISSVGYERVDVIKQAIAAGKPVAFGTVVSHHFSRQAADDEIIQPPQSDIAGNHAMVIGGYHPNYVDILNSWGADFGQNGWAKFSWDYIVDNRSNDLWVIDYCPKYSGES